MSEPRHRTLTRKAARRPSRWGGRRAGLRCGLAALLVVALVLGGLGRIAMAQAGSGHARVVIAGIAVSLCETGADAASAPDKDAHHDCDQCALRLTAVLAAPPPASVPVRLATALTLHSAGPAVAAGGPTWPAHRARGPPAA